MTKPHTTSSPQPNPLPQKEGTHGPAAPSRVRGLLFLFVLPLLAVIGCDSETQTVATDEPTELMADTEEADAGETRETI